MCVEWVVNLILRVRRLYGCSRVDSGVWLLEGRMGLWEFVETWVRGDTIYERL